jgi:hypothetical protein
MIIPDYLHKPEKQTIEEYLSKNTKELNFSDVKFKVCDDGTLV